MTYAFLHPRFWGPSSSIDASTSHFRLSQRPSKLTIYSQGILLDSDSTLSIAQKPFACSSSDWDGKDTKSLQAVIAQVKPHVLIGTSTKHGAFTKEVIQEMAKHVDRPIVFPLSNPTRLHEAQPKDINDWTDGKALIATGSPFPPVEHNGKK